uniref:Uncharacterized protein n=1 Tax=Glossina brevipalpis TaxID=37001 RepID=A0A1A9WQL9_9MUSC
MSRAHLRALHTTIGNCSQSANLAQSTNDVMMATDDGMADGMCSLSCLLPLQQQRRRCQAATKLFHLATFAAAAVTIIIVIVVHIQRLDISLFTASNVALAAIAFCCGVTLPRQ